MSMFSSEVYPDSEEECYEDEMRVEEIDFEYGVEVALICPRSLTNCEPVRMMLRHSNHKYQVKIVKQKKPIDIFP